MHIIHINDIHGFIREEGEAIGYPKIAGFIESFKAEHPDTLVLDAGDAFNGSGYASFDEGESVLSLLNTLGLDAMCAGNADFALGRARLLQLASKANFPILAGNIIDADGKSVLPGSATVTLPSGLRVGIVGLTTPRVGASSGLASIPAVEAGQRLVDGLRPHVDIIVGLFHLGDTAMDMDNSLLAARGIKGLDVIIDGHSHTFLPEGRVENGVLIAQTGEYSRNIGLVELELEEGGVKAARAVLLDKTALAQVPEKTGTAACLQGVCELCEPFFTEVVGSTAVRLNGVRNDLRLGETNMGDLFAEAMRQKAGTQIALSIAGIIGGDFKPGPLTRQDLLNMVRANGKVCKLAVSGEDILAVLEAGVSSYPTPAGTFLQVAGLSFCFDPQPGGKRVFNVKVGEAPLDPAARYSIATLEMMRKFPGLDKGVPEGDFGFIQDVLEEYIRAHSPLALVPDGRISLCVKPKP